MGDVPRRDSNLAVVGQSVTIEAFGEIVKLQTMNSGRPGAPHFFHGDDDPEDSSGLETLDRVLESHAGSDPILPPEQHGPEGLFHAGERPLLREDRFRLRSTGRGEEVRQRFRRVDQKEAFGAAEVETSR